LKEFSMLVKLMARLRGDRGCPWDRKQTLPVFKTFMLEEVYEAIDAIDRQDLTALREELGDLLFHIVFVAQICKENGAFDIKEVVEHVYRKMHYRHPHVFGKLTRNRDIEQKWEELKRQEKEDYSLLANIPIAMPALLRALIISKRVSRVGFDWEHLNDVHVKLSEEIEELRQAETTENIDAIREEIGDTLFTLVNIARFHKVDPEEALRATTVKFVRRFSHIEKNVDLTDTSLSAMEKLWNEAKEMEKEGG
jgi:tetrapyrrole methylase family protein / MazG family protein